MVQKQFVKMPEEGLAESPAAESPWRAAESPGSESPFGAAETQTVEALAAETQTVETLAAEAPAVEAVEEATSPYVEEALQQQRTGEDLGDDMSEAAETDASAISSASHWGSPGTCKVTDDTFFSVFDGAKKDASLLEADTDSDTDTNTDSGFRLKDFLKDGEAKDLWLVRGRAHDGSTVRIAARYWRNASATGHQIFLKSLSGLCRTPSLGTTEGNLCDPQGRQDRVRFQYR